MSATPKKMKLTAWRVWTGLFLLLTLSEWERLFLKTMRFWTCPRTMLLGSLDAAVRALAFTGRKLLVASAENIVGGIVAMSFPALLGLLTFTGLDILVASKFQEGHL